MKNGPTDKTGPTASGQVCAQHAFQRYDRHRACRAEVIGRVMRAQPSAWLASRLHARRDVKQLPSKSRRSDAAIFAALGSFAVPRLFSRAYRV
jgi:hypothetical protein